MLVPVEAVLDFEEELADFDVVVPEPPVPPLPPLSPHAGANDASTPANNTTVPVEISAFM